MTRAVAMTVAVAGTLLSYAGGPAEPALGSEQSAPPMARLSQYFYRLPPPIFLFPPERPRSVMSPFPVVRIVGRATRRGARIRILSVRAPEYAIITVLCRRGGCDRDVEARGRGADRAVRFRRFERSLRAGTVVEVRAEHPHAIGKFTSFRIMRRRAPRRVDQCLGFGDDRGSACPNA